MGTVFCAGLGPGDPDLMSVRSHRLISNARHIAYFRKVGRKGQARAIVDGMLTEGVTEHAMEYPVTTEIHFSDPEYNRMLAAFYDQWADTLAEIAQDEDVVVLCEGDPFLYGSYMHLYTRLQGRAEQEIIPGITGMSGCWTASGQPITWGDDVLTVAMATLSEDELAKRAAETDALVVMKIGRNLPKLRRALERAGRADDAWLVERGTMPGQTVQKLSEITGEVPYFSIVLVHGQGRRP
ncbi:precorrin-2 C(20)-methyltransferase [Phaeobacter gallaeciensis]|uniref:Precorrin-2 C(20)-methyltransferase CobI n=1 Tax=Phaeobacter gallaeciensis TaxID=60890 RepID=A0AAC9ZAX9_9RHOB|nr:precorrin-2 C(20)-methyltransferase [Phaeobacter gallaeciensis]AHD10413.1 precorrin-2 C20-methyltransferase [Phaeobacter gallaeciensis DSM 26640]ATE93676.1 precorrin-2 C(20)-methyltransferase CobI [Phaeobacter gallaeciensis]ATE96503.1 precorrin-2 C(20)-methyltransferase CobI [Phaeobacter gallaeciensis]ATF02340.1 precorrin-2 C(20)-methyltransferase CobI [Phaeobacter gallaeciensis]ATF06720.1 precorrin-2 C(20)-methyltransferase CobI [Phaeobacter gallaeciensis]